ncbi:hypothetical protein BDY19DRAFT_980522 [Irpex rosettiformis]|uniref:Uncharacterized protein n=1 Tax=Irpex rosettiformis TaxID=378272 RepID=A0ACB8TMB2_9APHY|nr:hypothetical protein BDY19DRAFT_980522 [Irpex rosettiformis]
MHPGIRGRVQKPTFVKHTVRTTTVRSNYNRLGDEKHEAALCPRLIDAGILPTPAFSQSSSPGKHTVQGGFVLSVISETSRLAVHARTVTISTPYTKQAVSRHSRTFGGRRMSRLAWEAIVPLKDQVRRISSTRGVPGLSNNTQSRDQRKEEE